MTSIEKRLLACGLSKEYIASLTEDEKFTAATGLTQFNDVMKKEVVNYLPAGSANDLTVFDDEENEYYYETIDDNDDTEYYYSESEDEYYYETIDDNTDDTEYYYETIDDNTDDTEYYYDESENEDNYETIDEYNDNEWIDDIYFYYDPYVQPFHDSSSNEMDVNLGNKEISMYLNFGSVPSNKTDYDIVVSEYKGLSNLKLTNVDIDSTGRYDATNMSHSDNAYYVYNYYGSEMYLTFTFDDINFNEEPSIELRIGRSCHFKNGHTSYDEITVTKFAKK